jgi:hypothetical protein
MPVDFRGFSSIARSLKRKSSLRQAIFRHFLSFHTVCKTFVTGRDLTEWGLRGFGTIDCPIRVRHIHGGLHLKAKISCGVTPRLRHGALTLF